MCTWKLWAILLSQKHFTTKPHLLEKSGAAITRHRNGLGWLKKYFRITKYASLDTDQKLFPVKQKKGEIITFLWRFIYIFHFYSKI